MKVGDLVWVHKPTPPHGQAIPELDTKPQLAVYLGEKTFDEKYTCSLVHFLVWESPLPQPRPIQTNLLEAVTDVNKNIEQYSFGRRLNT